MESRTSPLLRRGAMFVLVVMLLAGAYAFWNAYSLRAAADRERRSEAAALDARDAARMKEARKRAEAGDVHAVEELGQVAEARIRRTMRSGTAEDQKAAEIMATLTKEVTAAATALATSGDAYQKAGGAEASTLGSLDALNARIQLLHTLRERSQAMDALLRGSASELARRLREAGVAESNVTAAVDGMKQAIANDPATKEETLAATESLLKEELATLELYRREWGRWRVGPDGAVELDSEPALAELRLIIERHERALAVLNGALPSAP